MGRSAITYIIVLFIEGLLLGNGSAKAQQTAHLLPSGATASISGYVQDRVTGESLPAANILLDGTNLGTATDANGFFTLNKLRPGNYQVICTYIGYQKVVSPVSLTGTEQRKINIKLVPDQLQMQELVVESNIGDHSLQDIGVHSLDGASINKYSGAFGSDVLRSVQLLSGVKASSDYSSGLYVRGGSPDQTLIQMDGTTIYNPTHFYGFFSTFNPDAVRQVELYKGGYPARYGGSLGSVLNIENRAGDSDTYRGTVSLGMLDSHGVLEGPVPKGSLLIAFRRSTMGPVLSVLRKSIEMVPDQFYFYDINGKLSLDTSPNDKLKFTLYAGKDKVRVPIAGDSYFGLRYGNRTISGTWRHLFGDRAYSDYAITSSHYFNFPTMVIGGTGTDRANRIDEVSIRGRIHYFSPSGHKLEAGFATRYVTLDYTKSFNGYAAYLAHLPTSYNMGYVQDRWRIHNAWEVNGGLRFTSFSNGSYMRLAPRFSINFEPAEHLRFQGAYGRYYQFMSLNTNEAFTGFDLWLMSAQGVPPAWGDQYVLGFKLQPDHGIQLGLELYYRSMRDLFELDPFIPDITGLDYHQLFRTGTGFAWGAELTLEKSYGPLNGKLSYTLGITRRRFPGYNEDRFYPPRYDRLHDLKASVKLKLNSHWSFNAVFNYSTGQPYTKPVGHTFVTRLPFTNKSQNVLTIQKINNSRLPDYQRLDMGISRSGSFMGIIPATWKMQVINVYSYRNIWFYQYNFGGNSTRREKVTMLPALPALSYTLNF